MATVTLEGVTKVFPGGEVAVRDVDLTAEDGEFLVIVGPSGSGKSTLLRLVAGLEGVSKGRVLLDGENVTDMPPRERDLAMVFQSYALYPHKTVHENLAFGLRTRNASPERIGRRVEEVAETLEIEDLLERKPRTLSGGQQQRVALGRAIAREPRAFLLDEPLSNLDPALRLRTRTELSRLQRQLGATILHVTHDQEEAMTLGHRVAVMRRGRIQQVATPEELYRRPTNRFVGKFIGSPPMNFLRCTVRETGNGPVLEGSGVRLGGLPEAVGRSLTGMRSPTGSESSEVVVGVRPHDLELVGTDQGDVRERVELVEPLGSEVRMHVPLPDTNRTIVAVAPGDTEITAGATVSLRLQRDRLHFFRIEDGSRIGDGSRR